MLVIKAGSARHTASCSPWRSRPRLLSTLRNRPPTRPSSRCSRELIVAAAVVGLLPDNGPGALAQLAAFFDRVLPPGVSPLLDVAFGNTPMHAHSVRALVSAGLVSFLGASNVIATLMVEGLRRARDLPDFWTFLAAADPRVLLVPLSLVPLAIASASGRLRGHPVTGWLASQPAWGPKVRPSIYVVTLLLRWIIALGSSVGSDCAALPPGRAGWSSRASGVG